MLIPGIMTYIEWGHRGLTYREWGHKRHVYWPLTAETDITMIVTNQCEPQHAKTGLTIFAIAISKKGVAGWLAFSYDTEYRFVLDIFYFSSKYTLISVPKIARYFKILYLVLVWCSSYSSREWLFTILMSSLTLSPAPKSLPCYISCHCVKVWSYSIVLHHFLLTAKQGDRMYGSIVCPSVHLCLQKGSWDLVQHL